jgi:hypothetical protein
MATAEKFTDLVGEDAYNKFLAICYARAQVDMICDIPEKIVRDVRAEYPNLSREARLYALKTYPTVGRYPAWQ